MSIACTARINTLLLWCARQYSQAKNSKAMKNLSFFRPLHKQLSSIQDLKRQLPKRPLLIIESNYIDKYSRFSVLVDKGMDDHISVHRAEFDANDYLPAYLSRYIQNGFNVVSIEIFNTKTRS